jgi:hypothetical protein
VTREFITMSVTGARKTTTNDVLKRLAKALGLPVANLLK